MGQAPRGRESRLHTSSERHDLLPEKGTPFDQPGGGDAREAKITVFSGATCKGSVMLGNGCMTCEKCIHEIGVMRLKILNATPLPVDVPIKQETRTPQQVADIRADHMGSFMDECVEIADSLLRTGMLAKHLVTDRATVQKACEDRIAEVQSFQFEASLQDDADEFEPLSPNRIAQVVRALRTGTTKVLEAWAYAEQAKAWPPDDESA